MLNFIICDDENHMLNRLSALFEKAFIKNDFDAKIVLKTSNYKELLSYMSTNIVNVVVLDIEFKNSNVNGLNIAEEIRKINKDCYIIFITSHFEYLVQAYDYKTFAYLFKTSLSVDTLSDTLSRLFDDVSSNSKRFLKIDTKGTFIDLNDIQYIEKNGMKLIYHTSHGNFETYNSFSKIENDLPENFVRCHKSFIVNVINIANISLLNSAITFKNGDICYIGPKYKNYFMEVINYDTVSK
ncbi:MAG: response regulator transcription factor [Clostridia bacterium]|nr:response regulator transcription factor [Clostridia bacterium]